MVSKTRVALVMLALVVLLLMVIGLLAAVHADAVWYKIVSPGLLILGAVLAQSFGWFDKKSQD